MVVGGIETAPVCTILVQCGLRMLTDRVPCQFFAKNSCALGRTTSMKIEFAGWSAEADQSVVQANLPPSDQPAFAVHSIYTQITGSVSWREARFGELLGGRIPQALSLGFAHV